MRRQGLQYGARGRVGSAYMFCFTRTVFSNGGLSHPNVHFWLSADREVCNSVLQQPLRSCEGVPASVGGTASRGPLHKWS